MAEQVYSMTDEAIRAIEQGQPVSYAKHRNEAVGLDKGMPYVIVWGNIDFWNTVLTALAISATTPNDFTYPFESVHDALESDMQKSLAMLYDKLNDNG